MSDNIHIKNFKDAMKVLRETEQENQRLKELLRRCMSFINLCGCDVDFMIKRLDPTLWNELAREINANQKD